MIDQNYPGIDNKLYVNGVEVLGAFDNSHDGWHLYEFSLSPDAINNGLFVIELRASAAEGWGGPDYSELVITTTIPEPSSYAGLVGVACLGFVVIRRRK